jgi:hypothetical protein
LIDYNLGVLRGGTSVYPSVQRTLTSMTSTNSNIGKHSTQVCEGCGKTGHLPALLCFNKPHPNWNTKHESVPWSESAIGKAVKRMAHGNPKPLPPESVVWRAEDDSWTGGEKLQTWIKRIKSGGKSHSSTAASSHSKEPNTDGGKSINLGVVRGGTEVYLCPHQGYMTSSEHT